MKPFKEHNKMIINSSTSELSSQDVARISNKLSSKSVQLFLFVILLIGVVEGTSYSEPNANKFKERVIKPSLIYNSTLHFSHKIIKFINLRGIFFLKMELSKMQFKHMKMDILNYKNKIMMFFLPKLKLTFCQECSINVSNKCKLPIA